MRLVETLSCAGSLLLDVALNASQLFNEREFNSFGFPFSDPDPADDRRADAQLFRNPRVNTGVFLSSQKADAMTPRPCVIVRQCPIPTFQYCWYIPVGLTRQGENEKTGVQLVKPEFARKIEGLRNDLGLSQAELAKRFEISQVALSRWEAGLREPSNDIYMEMARLAGDREQRWYFWERAGLKKEDIERLAQALERKWAKQELQRIEVVPAIGALQPGSSKLKKYPDAVLVPLLKDAAAAGSPRLIEEAQVEDELVMPRRMCPHPQETTCIRISGDSMSPVLEDGYIVAVDTSDVDRARLHNQMVAARDPEGGVTIKWLRKVGEDELLMPQHTSPRHQPVIISRARGWKIVGRVLWWIGSPPPPPGGRKVS